MEVDLAVASWGRNDESVVAVGVQYLVQLTNTGTSEAVVCLLRVNNVVFKTIARRRGQLR